MKNYVSKDIKELARGGGIWGGDKGIWNCIKMIAIKYKKEKEKSTPRPPKKQNTSLKYRKTISNNKRKLPFKMIYQFYLKVKSYRENKDNRERE